MSFSNFLRHTYSGSGGGSGGRGGRFIPAVYENVTLVGRNDRMM